MKTRLISALLAIVFSFTLCVPAFATEKRVIVSHFDSSVPVEEREKALDGLLLTKNIGFGEEQLTRVSMVDGQIAYTFDVIGVENVIIPTKTEDSVIYRISDSEKQDVLEVYDNGNVIVNGHFVTTNAEKNALVSPRIVNDYWTEECPYGSPNDYTTSYDYDERATVDFGQNFGSFVLATLVGLLVLKIPPVAGLLISSAMGLGLVMQESSPMSTAASYKDWVYVHDETGWWVSTGMDPLAVKKHSAYIYALPNYGGNPTHITTYECRDLE